MVHTTAPPLEDHRRARGDVLLDVLRPCLRYSDRPTDRWLQVAHRACQASSALLVLLLSRTQLKEEMTASLMLRRLLRCKKKQQSCLGGLF
eukprot:SAG11_NODE_794_length_7137_cov_45.288576_5_plen_91_part_00